MNKKEYFDGQQELSRKELKEIKGGVTYCTSDSECLDTLGGKCINGVCAYEGRGGECLEGYKPCNCQGHNSYCVPIGNSDVIEIGLACGKICGL